MDKTTIAERLRQADRLIAEQRTHIDHYRAEVARLDQEGYPSSELRDAVEQMEAALAVYIQHREKLASR